MPDVAAAKLPELRRMAEEAGRDPARIEVSIYAAPTDAAALARLREAGIARAVLFVPSEPAEQVLPLLDRLAATAREVG
jgi:hypothetical protein